jgi:hypothetical protein
MTDAVHEAIQFILDREGGVTIDALAVSPGVNFWRQRRKRECKERQF